MNQRVPNLDMLEDDEDRGSGVGALLMLILGPLAATLIQLAISRTREYSADATSAQYTGTPYGLISGLQKLETYSKPSGIIRPFSRKRR